MPITKDNWRGIQDAVASLTQQDILVGIPASETDRYEADGPDDRKTGGISNAELGYINEMGSPAKNIPPRPFLNPGVKRVQDKTVMRQKKAANLALAGRKADVMKELNSIGLTAQHSVKNMIREGLEPALSPTTLAMRKRNGHMGEKPLIRTGQLLNSIDYVIRANNANSKRK